MENLTFSPKILLLDENRGIYIPQEFAKQYTDYVREKFGLDIEVLLAGPENEDYWDVWEWILQAEKPIEIDGQKYIISQDQEVWATHVDYDQIFPEYTVPEWAVCYIENGDTDNLTDSEIEAVNSFLKWVKSDIHGEFEFDGFCRENDIDNMAGNCYKVRFFNPDYSPSK